MAHGCQCSQPRVTTEKSGAAGKETHAALREEWPLTSSQLPVVLHAMHDKPEVRLVHDESSVQRLDGAYTPACTLAWGRIAPTTCLYHAYRSTSWLDRKALYEQLASPCGSPAPARITPTPTPCSDPLRTQPHHANQTADWHQLAGPAAPDGPCPGRPGCSAAPAPG